MHTKEKGSGDYNRVKIIGLGITACTVETGTSKMRRTHRVTVKITDKVLPKQIVELILDRRKGQI